MMRTHHKLAIVTTMLTCRIRTFNRMMGKLVEPFSRDEMVQFSYVLATATTDKVLALARFPIRPILVKRR